jgi:O-antigen ligase
VAVALPRRLPLTVELPRRLPLTTGLLSLGLVVMFAWERGVIVSSAGTRVGRIVLAAAAIALLVEMRGVTRIWELRKLLVRPPAALALGAGWLLVALVWVSSSTNGCRCSGGAQGLLEIEVWILLATVVALEDPGSRVMLLAASAAGCLLAAVLAFAGAHGSSTMDSASTRLAGTYGNSNYFAATQAIGMPIAVAGALQLRGLRWRIASAGATFAMAIALLLSYSRSGILAAGLGVALTILMIVPPPRRLAAAAGMAAVAGLTFLVAYPSFSRHRDQADLGSKIAAFRETDASGWSWYPTGMVKRSASAVHNVAPGVLQIVTNRRGEGASVNLGAATPGAYRLRFDLRTATARQIVRYGLEDDRIGAGPAYGVAVATSTWKPMTISWSPTADAADARAYFWAGTSGSIELRRLRLVRHGQPAETVSVRLLGPGTSVQSQIDQVERRYLRSRAGAARLALDAFTAHPAFGVGWERFPFYSAPRSGVGAIAAHDEYLRFAAELGVPGLLALLLVCAGVAWAAFDARRAALGAALAGLLIAGAVVLAFGDVLEAPSVFLPAATGVALVVALSAAHRKDALEADRA